MRIGMFQLVAAVCLMVGCSAQNPDVALLKVSLDASLNSPQKALDEVLRLRSSGCVAKDRQITVEFDCGTYAVEKPLEITAAHGPLLLKGAGALGTVFSAGRQLGRFRVETNGRAWRTPVAADWNFDQLFINRQRAFISSPEKCRSPWLPGAWYREDGTHELIYIARPGEGTGSTVAIAGALENVMVVKGAADVTIEGISFMHNASGREGAAGAIVRCVDTRRVVFSGCGFRHCANYGLKVMGSSAEVEVRHCRFDDTGSGAIFASGTDRLVFEDNIVNKCGTSPDGAAVRVENCRGGKVVHNDFCRLECKGVTCSGAGCENKLNRFWKVPGVADSPRMGEAGVSGKDPAWRARVELLTFD